jgi:RimJ/RimL family protein N-acetyltransferase
VILAALDLVSRDAVRRGDLGGRTAAPGWPHEDTEPVMGYLDRGGLAFLIVDDAGRVAGECGTKAAPDAEGAVEIGYGLASTSRGRGLGGAAVAALVSLLEQRTDVVAIDAEVHVGNVASQRVLERLGFLAAGADSRGYHHYRLCGLGRME